MKRKNEIKVGIVIVVGVAMLVFGFQFLSGLNIFSKERQFYAIYERVEG